MVWRSSGEFPPISLGGPSRVSGRLAAGRYDTHQSAAHAAWLARDIRADFGAFAKCFSKSFHAATPCLDRHFGMRTINQVGGMLRRAHFFAGSSWVWPASTATLSVTVVP